MGVASCWCLAMYSRSFLKLLSQLVQYWVAKLPGVSFLFRVSIWIPTLSKFSSCLMASWVSACGLSRVVDVKRKAQDSCLTRTNAIMVSKVALKVGLQRRSSLLEAFCIPQLSSCPFVWQSAKDKIQELLPHRPCANAARAALSPTRSSWILESETRPWQVQVRTRAPQHKYEY